MAREFGRIGVAYRHKPLVMTAFKLPVRADTRDAPGVGLPTRRMLLSAQSSPCYVASGCTSAGPASMSLGGGIGGRYPPLDQQEFPRQTGILSSPCQRNRHWVIPGSRLMQFIANSCASGSLLLALVPAQTTWRQLHPAVDPPGRSDHTMTYDSVRQNIVMFGGISGAHPRNDTWIWGGQEWIQVFPSVSPPARSGHGMAFDAARGLIVMCGGRGATTTSLHDTWEWDGSDWRLASSQPEVGDEAELFFDPALRSVVMLSGGGSTFAWNGIRWHDLQARAWSGTSGARGGFSAVYHTALGQAITTVQRGSGTTAYTETLVWAGQSWTSLGDLGGRSVNYALSYDSSRHVIVMVSLTEVFEWDGGPWRLRIPWGRPPNHDWYRHAAAFDPRSGQTIVFGGVDFTGGAELRETWEYFGSPATFEALGSGCLGTVGVPILTVSAIGGPWVSESLNVRISNLPSGLVSVPFGLIGFSNVTWGSLPLPYSLNALGAPNCNLLVSTDDVIQLINQGGHAVWSLRIPSLAILVGAEFFQQGLVLDRSANQLGVVLSNAARIVIGAR